MTIVVEDLWKSFGPVEVLKGLSVTVNKGETLVIVGRSGVGKSVLLRHIMGLERPDRGRVMIDGVEVIPVNGRELKQPVRNIGMLFQGSALFDSMSVAENTAFYLLYHGDPVTGKIPPPDEIMERVHTALAMVDLAGTEDKMPSDLSGGMRKRAALARLIAYRPSILLYDEPTTGLDPITATQINQLIIETQKNLQATSIVVTHDMTSAFAVGDRIALHHDGKLIYIEDKATFAQIDHPIIREFMRYSALRPEKRVIAE
jgi:phospholipid/cholesterol/gamma-HCH transport system ATP-binding protein